MDILSKQFGQGSINHSYLLISSDADLAINKIKQLLQDLKIDWQDRLIWEDWEKLKISEIRNLQKFLYLKPAVSNYKVAIIKYGENFTIEAANALLKTLEEPPNYAIIMIIVPSKEAVLKTISSRCQKIQLNQLRKIRSNSLNWQEEAEKIQKLTLKDRFEYANNLSQKEDMGEILTDWLLFLSQNLFTDTKNIVMMKKITDAQKILAKYNVNKRLLIENLLIDL